MATISAREARANFSDLLNRVAYTKKGEVITRNRKKIAAMIPVELYTLLEDVLDEFEYKKDVAEARQALAEVEREGTVPWNKVKSKIGR